MLNELITWVLNTYLGKYLEDFNPAQLSVAFLSGEVELENVPIRKDALRSFGIPMQALSGSIGKIKLQIPVRQFRTAPWCIVIERVYGVFGPKDISEWDDEKEKNSELEYKLAELDADEAKWRVENGYNIDNYYSSSYSSWISYGTSLATNILENLELKIMDVHLRYEDTVILSSKKFCAGIKISSLTAQTSDANWIPGAKTASNQTITYKLIELKDFSVYWDKLEQTNTCAQLPSKDLLLHMNDYCDTVNHQYIINPISAKAHCKRERCKHAIRSKARPRLSCEVLITAVKISISDIQFKEMVDCIVGLNQIDKIRSFKILRPENNISSNVPQWWRYAAKCYGFTFYTSEKKWETLRENLRYIRIYKRLLINPNENIGVDDKQFKQQMEKCRTLNELQTLRGVCYSNVFTKDLSLKTRNINQGKGMLYHWFPNWWGWYGNTENNQLHMQDEAYKNIENDILNALEDTIENTSFSKRDAVFAYCTFVLVEGQLLICTEDTNNSNSIMFEMDFENLISFVEMKPRFSSYLIGISLGSVCLKDMLTKGTEFPFLIKPQMIETQQTKNNGSNEFKRFFVKSNNSNETDPWFQLQYEKGPTEVQTDFRLIVKSRSLDIVYNEYSFARLIAFWTKPLKILNAQYESDNQYISNTKMKFLKNWKSLLTESNEHRKTWSFEIDISAPRIIFVENFFEKNTAIVLVDFGRFQLLKNEAKRKESVSTYESAVNTITSEESEDDESFKTPCSTPPGSKNSHSESPTLIQDPSAFTKFVINNETGLESAFHSKIYDKYTINLMDLQVLVCKNRERSYASFKNTSNFHLLNKFNISLQLERRVIYTIDPEYPSLTLFGSLQKIVAHVNEQKLNDVFKIMRPINFENIFGSNDNNPQAADMEEDTSEIPSSDVDSNNVNINANLLVLQFVIGQIILEVQSYEKSIAELQIIGARAGIVKKMGETNITMSVHGLLLVDAIQSFGPDFELLVASHRHVGMDSISGSLKQSEPCSPISIESPDPMATQRPMSPFMINKAVNNIQSGKFEMGLDFDDMHALISIEINLVDAGENNDSLLLANITFNNLDIIATQETIVELLGFLKRITQLDRRNIKQNTIIQEEQQKAKDNISSFQYERTEICFDFHRLNILVLRTINKDGFQMARKVGTLTMSEAKIHATLAKDVSVSGSLGGIQIIDITPEGINHQRIFSVGKDPLTDPPELQVRDLVSSLTNEMYCSSVDVTELEQNNALVFKIWREGNVSVNIKIRMASVWYTHCPRFIQEINTCIAQFKNSLSNFAKSIRNKATDMAMGLVQHINETNTLSDYRNNHMPNSDTGQLSVDIILNSPVLVLPRSSESSDVLVANLGKITAYNMHEASGYSIMTTNNSNAENSKFWKTDNYFIDIRNINLFSLNTSQRKELRVSALPKAKEFYACNNDAVAILHDTAMLFKFTNSTKKVQKDNEWISKYVLSIEGSVTQMLQVSLSRVQYNQLTESLCNAMKFSSVTQNVDSKYINANAANTVDDLDKSVRSEDASVIDVKFSVPVFKMDLKNEHNDSLINITFREFSIYYNQKQRETSLRVLLRSVLMEDLKSAIDSSFRNMVNSLSHTECETMRNKYCSASCPNLLNLNIGTSKKFSSMPTKLHEILDSKPVIPSAKTVPRVSDKKVENHPLPNGTNMKSDENLVIYNSKTTEICTADKGILYKTKSSIDFNCLNLIVSLDRWFMVFDFFGLVSENDVRNVISTKDEVDYGNSNRISELKVSVKSLNLILIRNEEELSKANISNACFKIKNENVTKTVEGRLKSISLYDLTPFGNLYREKFSTAGPEALSFHYKTLNAITKRSELPTLDKDALLQIKMSSVRYIHTKRFIVEIHLFVKELLQLQTPVIQSMKLSETESSKALRPIQIGLEIHADSPIILLPLSYHSNQVIIADLGEFTLTNEFHWSNDEIIISKMQKPEQTNAPFEIILDVMNIDLVNINLFGGERIKRNTKLINQPVNECLSIGNFTVLKMGNNLFKETCHLKLQVERNTDTTDSNIYPDISVKGTLSKLNGVVNLDQYKLIRGFLSYNLGEIIDDVYFKYSFNVCESIERLSSMNRLHQPAKDEPIRNTLSINLLLENVAILLANQIISDHEVDALACINFIKSSLEIDSFSDGSQDIDLISREILIMDSRNSQHQSLPPTNAFKYILKPKQGDTVNDLVQAEIHSRRKPGSAKYTILLNNMRIMAILDCIELLKNFLQEEPYKSNSITPVHKNVLDRQVSKALKCEEEPTENMEIVLNITDSEVIFVETFEKVDTNAIILKSTTVLSYKPNNDSVPVSININHLEIFSCILGFEEASALSIIDPFTLNVELRKNCFQISIQKQLCIRLSYNDVKLITKMLQSIPKQTNKSKRKQSSIPSTYKFEQIAPLVAMGFSQRDCWHAMDINNGKLNDAAIWLAKHKHAKNVNTLLEVQSVVLNASGIAICVIDDCLDADVPLLELCFSNLSVRQELKPIPSDDLTCESGYIANLATVIASNYYNRHLSGWEPIVEPWECNATWHIAKTTISPTKTRRLNINVSSMRLLKFNITTTLIELCEMVRTNWTQDYYNAGTISSDSSNSALDRSQSTATIMTTNFRRRSPFVPFALQNLTGEPLFFKTMCSQPGGITRTVINQQDILCDWIAVQPEQIMPFDFESRTKLRHMDSHNLNVHQILVQIFGWTLVGPVSIDRVGTFFRYATLDLQFKKRTRIVFEISLVGSAQKLITVKSALNISNKLEKRIFLKMDLKNEDKMALACIEPNEQLSVPLRLVESLMFFKPCLPGTAADEQLWKTVAKNKIAFMNNSILNQHQGKNVGTGTSDIVSFCTRAFSWMDIGTQSSIQELYSCYSNNKTVFHTFIDIKQDKYPCRDLSNMPGHTMTLLPPLTIKNMLCCDLLYKITGHVQGRIMTADTVNIYSINPHEAFNLSITLDNYKLSGQLKIPKGHSGAVEPKLKLIDLLNRELCLRVSIQLFPGHGMEIYISAPVWILNRTGLSLVYRQAGTNSPASGQFEEHERARVVTPLIFSFSDNEGLPSLEIRLGKSYGENNPWCKSFSIHKEITYRELRAERSRGCYSIGINVRRGRGIYACTTFVTLSPRFQLFNKTSRKLEFAQKCDIQRKEVTIAEKLISALPGCNFPFHWPNCEEEPLLCVRISDVDFCNWSSPIPMNEVQSLYINIRNDLGEMNFLRLEVVSQGATYNLLFSDAHTLPPPIRIDNFSEVLINFSQSGCKPYWRTPVRPQSSLAYVLDDPMGVQALYIEAPGGNTVDFPLGNIDLTRHVTYANFIYIAFQETFKFDNNELEDTMDEDLEMEIGGQQLVLGVQDRKVLLMRKCTGDRSQLWLMNSNGQLEHEGSSPPSEFGRSHETAARMVLDLEKAPNPTEFTNLVIRLPNKQRVTTQTWRFENGRLMCHANMCVQTRNGIYGLKHGAEAVLGIMESNARNVNENGIPIEQCINFQKLRPGSGHLELNCRMDGPIRTIQIFDVKMNREEITLAEDPSWNHASLNNKTNLTDKRTNISHECILKVDLQKGAGISIITRQPCEELAYITFENIKLDVLSTPNVKSFELRINDLQIDNQLLETSCPVLLYSSKSTSEQYALLLRAKVLPSPNENAVIFEYLTFDLNPCMVYLEERLILKAARFFGYGKNSHSNSAIEYENEPHNIERTIVSTSSRRYYFENLNIGPTQIRLSVFTAPKLTPELSETKKAIGLTLIKFEDALIEFDKFSVRHNFETLNLYLKAIKSHYVNQMKWHAASILGSVDFLGNPLGFANDLSEGVSGLLFEGSVISLVKNVTHGISNSTAKLTETLSDSLGKVVLDDHDNDTRQRILEIQTNSSSSHLAAGLKGFGFGLLGGVTSIVRHTYDGAQTDGFPGFLSGLGKGLVGTVTKPIIGVLDLASETATAVRESSRGSHRSLPDRKRLPRCVTGAPGGLLPVYSYRQSKGQQYLYIINRRNFTEKLISYEPYLCNDREAKLRLLVSTECIRIFSRCDEDPTIMFDCHLSEVLSCHPLTTNASNSNASTSKAMAMANYYIEISTNLPKITRPRVRCQDEETAENAARCINYAKSVFDEREQSMEEDVILLNNRLRGVEDLLQSNMDLSEEGRIMAEDELILLKKKIDEHKSALKEIRKKPPPRRLILTVLIFISFVIFGLFRMFF